MSPPLRQVAYDNFKKRLFDRTLTPGLFISQRELCEVLESPMGAVREALKRLEAEGLINLLPQRGVQIADVNVRLINEAFQFRILIELDGARRVANAQNTATLTELADRTEQMRIRAGRGSDADHELMAEGLEVDLDLHQFLVESFRNSLIQETHQIIQDKVRLIRMNRSFDARRLEKAMGEHLMIIKALMAGDEEAGVRELKAHLSTSWRRALGNEELDT
ncbi:MAG: GntR family transcriptional regulator [Paracoccus sp. (in: a-proteobacteria)]